MQRHSIFPEKKYVHKKYLHIFFLEVLYSLGKSSLPVKFGPMNINNILFCWKGCYVVQPDEKHTLGFVLPNCGHWLQRLFHKRMSSQAVASGSIRFYPPQHQPWYVHRQLNRRKVSRRLLQLDTHLTQRQMRRDKTQLLFSQSANPAN